MAPLPAAAAAAAADGPLAAWVCPMQGLPPGVLVEKWYRPAAAVLVVVRLSCELDDSRLQVLRLLQ
jgi:hypothetical protein